MKRNLFGDPQPKGVEEICEALEERDINEPWATIEFNEDNDDPVFDGWAAEISGVDSDGEDLDYPIYTLGYSTKDELVLDLTAAGIPRGNITLV